MSHLARALPPVRGSPPHFAENGGGGGKKLVQRNDTRLWYTQCLVLLYPSFLFICSKSSVIDEPKVQHAAMQDGKKGATWSVPHSIAPHREDIDKGVCVCVCVCVVCVCVCVCVCVYA